MSESPTLAEASLRNISDTARWSAVHRAIESERPDAFFRDPFARRLAGERGEQILKALTISDKEEWSWVARTYLFDRFITRQIEQGTDMVINIAAGLDARPYRMPLPATLQWIEVDLPAILNYKEEILADEKPVCRLERLRLDLSNASARRDAFAELDRRARKALLITEGFLVYLAREEAAALARDFALPKSFQSWAFDVMSPGLVRMLTKRLGAELERAGAPFKFGPPEGPGFFVPHGWKPVEVHSFLKTAAKLKRLPFLLRLLALLPESKGAQGSRPWAGACLFTKA
ncbi:MAG: SAM-dependent methyltransferase [Acidobacteriia bacterium]|nr:SAM-dependent methyltransferase [Terriglobia bacterium]